MSTGQDRGPTQSLPRPWQHLPHTFVFTEHLLCAGQHVVHGGPCGEESQVGSCCCFLVSCRTSEGWGCGKAGSGCIESHPALS